MSERVILLHGLWMRAAALAPLAQRLRAAGFAPETFDYHSLRGGPDAAAQRLRDLIYDSQGGPVHLVGHSLGGLVALEVARQITEREGSSPIGRVVCLGSPLRGSAAAVSMVRHWGTGWLMGDSAALLQRGLENWCGRCEVGVIAGKLPVGLGFLLGGLARPHDGTVTVAETELPGIHGHCVVSTSHTGLLLSGPATRQTVAFLRHGRFEAA